MCMKIKVEHRARLQFILLQIEKKASKFFATLTLMEPWIITSVSNNMYNNKCVITVQMFQRILIQYVSRIRVLNIIRKSFKADFLIRDNNPIANLRSKNVRFSFQK
jgi:hypothetical protein